MVKQLDMKETLRTKVGLTGLGSDGTREVKGAAPEVRSVWRGAPGDSRQGDRLKPKGTPRTSVGLTGVGSDGTLEVGGGIPRGR